MDDELKKTQDFFEIISDRIHYFVRENVSNSWELPLQLLAKFLLLSIIAVLLNLFFRLIFKSVHSLFYKKFSKTPFLQALYESKVLNSVANFIALVISQELIYSIFWRHKKSYALLERIFDVLLIIALYILYKRILKSIERFYFFRQDFYRLTAIRAITQSLNILGIIFFIFIGISNIFGISSSTIITSLTAMTAVLVLVFRDTILGFVTGIHVSTSKNLKVGDWIGIPKYNIEGTVQDISLLTTKILNFDKTVSTVPTYDLLTTEIKNHQNIAEGHSRRIKKSIILNANSFKFVDKELIGKLQRINLLSEYINDKQTEILKIRNSLQNPELLINGRQLTNVGLFRQYAKKYLEANPKVDQEEVIMVRQLDVTPQGMPMEIYCFANKTQMLDFENIQADIFDHLLASAREFDLEVLQITKI